MADIPSQFSFEHMLSHMFPGFFAALSIVMILDLQSPFHLAEFISRDTNTLISFYGILLLGGTIIGVLIDGIHHRYIEGIYFNYLEGHEKSTSGGDKEIKLDDIVKFYTAESRCDERTSEAVVDSNCIVKKQCKFTVPEIKTTGKVYFLFDPANLDKNIALRDYLTKTIYHYSEFYANTFIALIPFTLITPMYLLKKLHIGICMAFLAGVLLAILTVVCLDLAWTVYKRWISALYFAFCKCPKSKKLEPQKSIVKRPSIALIKNGTK